MVNIVIPEWGVVVSLLGFAITLSVVMGAIYSRIGRLEGTITTKLNGAFGKLCEDVEKVKGDIGELKTDVAVLKERL